MARVIRQKLRKDGISKGVKVVYSTEPPMKPREDVTQRIVPENAPEIRKAQQPPASNAFVPPVAGLIMVSVAVRDLLAAGGVPESICQCIKRIGRPAFAPAADLVPATSNSLLRLASLSHLPTAASTGGSLMLYFSRSATTSCTSMTTGMTSSPL